MGGSFSDALVLEWGAQGKFWNEKWVLVWVCSKMNMVKDIDTQKLNSRVIRLQVLKWTQGQNLET